MSTLFDWDAIFKLLKPFKAAFVDKDVITAPYLKPIKYEMLNPDKVCYLFHAKDERTEYGYWVLLETDYLGDLDHAREMIEDWYGGKVLKFIKHDVEQIPRGKEIDEYAYEQGHNFLILAKVDRPTGDSYWANVFTVMPGDVISEKIAHLSEAEKKGVRKALVPHLAHRPVDAGQSFLETYQARKALEIEQADSDTNTSNFGFWIYIDKKGQVDIFYNPVK